MDTTKFAMVCAVAAYLLASSNSLRAADIDRDAFENSVYGISEISHFHALPEELNQLPAASRSDVVLAKSVLVNVLKSVQDKNGDPRLYLSPALNKQFPTKQGFAQSLLDEETSILSLMIYNFSVSRDGSQVTFKFSVVVDSEGSIIANDRSATIQKFGQDWKLTAFK